MTDENRAAVFVFTTSYYPFVGGAEIAIQEIARRLSGDFDFFIFTARFDKNLAVREKRPEGTIIRLGLGRSFDKWLLLILGPLAARRELRRLNRRIRVLLWGVDVSSGCVAAALLKFFCRRMYFVFNVHYGYGLGRLRRGRFGAIGLGFRFMLGQANLVTAISIHLAETARSFGYRQKIKVIPNGVSLEQYQGRGDNPSGLRSKIIITVSRLVVKNGLDVLIRAIAELKRRGLDVVCHIVGDGPERQSLEALTHSLDLSGEVTFFGNVPHKTVPSHLAAADIFVRPSRSEGMGNAFVEALAAGLPIIGTPVGGIVDIIHDGKTGLFCKVDDPKDLAEKIKILIVDQTLARRIVNEGQAMVRERFSWDNIAESYRRIFSKDPSGRPRILIAVPQFPPDIGGPGSYAENLAEHLLAKGCEVSILAYGQKKLSRFNLHNRKLSRFNLDNVWVGWPSGLKHFVYFLKSIRLLQKCDAALVFDPVIVGFPVTLASLLLSKPMIIRVEGDFLWEWFSERTKSGLTLRQFYEEFKAQRLSLKEWLMNKLAGFVFSRACFLVFSSQWRKDIFRLGYPLKSEQPRLIPPAWSEVSGGRSKRENLLLFAGRFIHIKNLGRLIRVFIAVAPPQWRLELVGQGPERKNLEFLIKNSELSNRVIVRPPVAGGELLKLISSARGFLLPSLSDVSPNVILDCLATATPFLLTRESGFYEALKDVGLFVDPLDEKDIADKLGVFFDARRYAVYLERFRRFKAAWSWDQAAGEWLALIENALGRG